MRLEDMLKDISDNTNRVIESNCFSKDSTVLDGLETIKYKINEVIEAINNGIIKGDKGDTPNIKVGETTQLDPSQKAYVNQTGDMLNPILNFGIPKGDKGDKGDTGKASETINDSVTSLDHTWSSQKINEFVNNKFNSLEDVQGVKYVTDKEYLVMSGTKNGVVKDLKLYGKSLVNIFYLLEIKGVSNNANLYAYSKNPKNSLGKKITIYNNSLKRIVFDINSDTNNSWKKSITVEVNSSKYVLLESDEYVNVIYGRSIDGWFVDDAGKSDLKKSCMIIEGDHTQNPHSYFEGIASVGNGNEIEVLSRKEDGNLFDGGLELGSLGSNGEFVVTTSKKVSDYIFVLPNETLKTNVDVICCYDSDKKFINRFVGLNVFTTPKNCKYIRFRTHDIGSELYQDNYFVGKSNNIINKQDKKTILFKDTDNTWKPILNLRGIDENNCDIVDSGKGKLVKKYEKVTINSSNGFKLVQPSSNVKTTQFWNDGHTLLPKILKNNNKIICDKLNIDVTTNKDEEFFLNGSVSFVISLNKEKASTLEQLDEYLSQNPITFVYEILTEEYEINPLYPESYDNETMILFNTGVISGKKEFYIDSNLGSLTLENMNRISNLENEVYKVNTALLRGDLRLVAETYYPEDFKKEVLPNE